MNHIFCPLTVCRPAGVLVLLFLVQPVQAKRSSPPEVQVSRGALIYRAIQWTVAEHGTTSNGGLVQVSDQTTQKVLWSLQVYCIEQTPGLEGDTQDVFISSLVARSDELVVTDERGDVFSVDLKTKKVSTRHLAPRSDGQSRVYPCESAKKARR